MKNFLTLLVFVAFVSTATAQNGALSPSAYRTMVIPYAAPNQKIGAMIQSSPMLRQTLMEFQNMLVNAGYSVSDFNATHQNFIADQRMKPSVSDTKTELLDYASPDIYIELEISVSACPDYPGMNKAVVNLKPWLTATNHLLAPIVCTGNCFQVQDSFALTRQAIKMNWPDFERTYTRSLSQIAEHGQPVNMSLSIADNSGFDFNKTVKTPSGRSESLSSAIHTWLDERPLGGGYRSRGITAQRLELEDVRMPMLHEKTQRFYKCSQLANELTQLLQNMEVEGFTDGRKIRTETNVVGSKIWMTLK